jgi:hypothetical protein
LATATEPLPAPAASAPPAAAWARPPACGIDCNGREMVAIHLATPYGVSGRLLVPVLPRSAAAVGGPAFAAGCQFGLSFSVSRTAVSPTPVARVDEFYRSPCDALEIAVPASFIPPARGVLQLTLRDDARGETAATFDYPNPFFDGSRGRYVIAGGDLRNFVGDTTRPATDKTLRGAVKTYLDAQLAAGRLTEDGDAVRFTLTAEIVAGERAVPVAGSIPVSATRRGREPLDLPLDAD